MQYRPLGRTGLTVSEVSLGTWAFGAPVYGAVGADEAHRAIRGALDAGITFFDTAPLYGTKDEDGIAETVLGRALGADRDKVTIATKFGRYPTRGHLNTYFNADGVTTSVEDSLRRLGTDHLDVLFFHSPFGPDQIEDNVWGALDRLKSSGKVRHVGHSISLFDQTEAMAREWIKADRIDVVQLVYSLMNRETEQFMADAAAAGVGIVARESLANGFLAGVFTCDTTFPAGTINARYSREEIIERVSLADLYKTVLVERNPGVDSLACAAMRWVLDNPAVSLVLTGSRKLDEVLDCARASDLPPFTETQHEITRRLHSKDYPPA